MTGRLSQVEDWQKAVQRDQDGLIGEVRMWWGPREKIPAGWEICEGGRPTTPGARLDYRKPDLADRFPKGTLAYRMTVAELERGRGGSHDLPAHHHGLGTLATTPGGGGHTHTGGEHQHSVLASDDDHGDGDCVGNAERDEPRGDVTTQPGQGTHTHTGGEHGHTFTGVVGNPSGLNGDAPMAGANQPAYAEIFFIIRVK